GNSGAYDLSISGIEWDEASHQLVAEVQNPNRITGAIDFRVEHGMESSRVPTVFSSSETVSRIGLGTPGQRAGRDRFADCRPVYTVTIDDSNRVDERNETNNSFTGRIGYSSAVGIYLLRNDAYENSMESLLSATPGELDWDYKGNGNTIIFRLRVRNCGARTVGGTIEISQEACFPGSGGGRICYTPEVRLVRSQSLSIDSTHEGIIDVTQGDLAQVGSGIIISFSGDIAAYAPANPVRIHMRE
ncbi:MAG TPA: hypothetical protein VHO84_02530, partial [Syntrophorhabdaceae bacterium]|nr:hypothetical protein [Syntrophorhabdaceae bacterium]